MLKLTPLVEVASERHAPAPRSTTTLAFARSRLRSPLKKRGCRACAPTSGNVCARRIIGLLHSRAEIHRNPVNRAYAPHVAHKARHPLSKKGGRSRKASMCERSSIRGSGSRSLRSDFCERYQSPYCAPREQQEQGATCDRATSKAAMLLRADRGTFQQQRSLARVPRE
jgi:hypothetical protein